MRLKVDRIQFVRLRKFAILKSAWKLGRIS